MVLINTDKAKARLNETHQWQRTIYRFLDSIVNSSRFLWVSLATERKI